MNQSPSIMLPMKYALFLERILKIHVLVADSEGGLEVGHPPPLSPQSFRFIILAEIMIEIIF
jgi:hypothetical protein